MLLHFGSYSFLTSPLELIERIAQDGKFARSPCIQPQLGDKVLGRLDTRERALYTACCIAEMEAEKHLQVFMDRLQARQLAGEARRELNLVKAWYTCLLKLYHVSVQTRFSQELVSAEDSGLIRLCAGYSVVIARSTQNARASVSSQESWSG